MSLPVVPLAANLNNPQGVGHPDAVTGSLSVVSITPGSLGATVPSAAQPGAQGSMVVAGWRISWLQFVTLTGSGPITTNWVTPFSATPFVVGSTGGGPLTVPARFESTATTLQVDFTQSGALPIIFTVIAIGDA